MIKAYPDLKLIRKILTATTEQRSSILQTCKQIFGCEEKEDLQFVLDWPGLLEYLNFNSALDKLPILDPQNKIFQSIVDILKFKADKEVVVYLYDQIFVEYLRLVKATPQVHFDFLINEIQSKSDNPLFQGEQDPFSVTLVYYKNRLIKQPKETLHDLVLYLAWDRVCVFLGRLFDDTSLQASNGLEILRECLIESFQHITEDGKTLPSLYRLIEALYAFKMKEESLQSYSEKEWDTLCKSSQALQSIDSLADASYVDDSLSYREQSEPFALKFLTLDNVDTVKARLMLTKYMLNGLKEEVSKWPYVLRQYDIACLKENSGGVSLSELLH